MNQLTRELGCIHSCNSERDGHPFFRLLQVVAYTYIFLVACANDRKNSKGSPLAAFHFPLSLFFISADCIVFQLQRLNFQSPFLTFSISDRTPNRDIMTSKDIVRMVPMLSLHYEDHVASQLVTGSPIESVHSQIKSWYGFVRVISICSSIANHEANGPLIIVLS